MGIGLPSLPLHACSRDAIVAVLGVLGLPDPLGHPVAHSAALPFEPVPNDAVDLLRLHVRPGRIKDLAVLDGGDENILAPRDKLEQQLIVALDDREVLLHQTRLLLYLGVALAQLRNHGVERLGALAHAGDRLRIVAACDLLGLPGQVIKVRVDIFQVLAEKVLA